MEASGAADEVVSWGSHHSRLGSQGGVIFALCVFHHGPDPQGSLVVRSHVCSGDQFGSILVVTSFSFWAEVFVSPADSFVVDVSASVSLLVINVEISIFNTSMLLNALS